MTINTIVVKEIKNLLVWLKLDGDALDSSFNDNDGTWNGTEQYTTGKQFTQSADFDGSNINISLGDDDTWSLDNRKYTTISLWFNKDVDGTRMSLLSKGKSSEFEFELRTETTNLINMIIFTAAGGTFMNVNSVDTVLASSGWNHLFITYDRDSPELKIYLNNELKATDSTSSGSYTNNTANLKLGERDDNNNDLDGQIQDFRIYDKVLTEKERNSIYNEGLASIYSGVDFGDTINVDVSKETGENNKSSNFTAKFENTEGLHKDDFSINDEIVVKGNKDATPDTTIFRGLIEDISFDGRGDKKSGDTITISGRDFTARLQDIKVEPSVFTNTEVSVIVTSIMTAVPDVTTNNVNVTSTTLNKITFNHLSVFDALKQLAKESGYYFYIDEDKDLNFKQKSSTVSGVLLNNTNITKSQFRTLDREMANNVWVYGDRVLTGIKELSVPADGGSVFTLDYRPYNTNVFVGGSTTPKVGGIFEVLAGDVGSPTQYLVNFDERQIVFVSGTEAGDNIPVSGVDDIDFEYERKKQIVKFGIDRASDTSFGRKDKIIVDKNIINPNTAIDRVKTELLENSSPFVQGTVQINNIINLTPGDLLTVNLPNSNQDNVNYEILQVKYRFTPENNFGNNVTTVKLNRRILDINDTIKNLVLDLKQVQGDDIFNSEELTRLEQSIGSFGIRVKEWNVKTRTIGDSFVLGHPTNGILGSPVIGTSGGQVVLGSGTAGAFTTVRSGTDL